MTVADLLAALRQMPPGTMVPAAEMAACLEEVCPIGRSTPAASQAAADNGDAPDRLLNAADVAERMDVSKRYVYANAPAWPFTRRLGRAVRFSAAGLEVWLARSGG